ncbi:MAG TPA: NADH-quinone oxidoreductase subunit L [Chthoniobacterales bacterium]
MSTLPWTVLFTPLVAATIIALVTRPIKTLSAGISVLAVAISFVGSVILFFQPDHAADTQFMWLNLPQLRVPFGVTISELEKLMLLVVSGIGLLIHIYSLGYMKDDTGKSRYFAGLSLFIFSMLGIVLANNFVMMFICWELVGVSSYLLIGHWFERPAAAEAAKKAFLVNRIGDFGFMLGILMVWLATGSVVFSEIAPKWAGLNLPGWFLTLSTLGIFAGAVGKSAQVPLHVWLPDAMEGPTPVSALIHAATMVAAGVFMLAKTFFLFVPAHTTLDIIMWIGIATAVLAALMATQQDDIKRILAYSTLSQLGYMICAIGLSAPAVGMFHLFTHASFKALLFLGAGSVIHSLHHEQNIWNMGGVGKKMPITFVTFTIATAALTGVPFLSGFFSKDAIIGAAFEHNKGVFMLAVFVAALTSYYMFRLWLVTFFGKPRGHGAEHAHESPLVMTVPLVLLAILSVIAGYPFVIKHLLKLPEEHAPAIVPILAVSAFLVGLIAAVLLYKGREKDPIEIRLFANKFYIDEAYAALVKSTQDAAASISAFIDKWVLDALLVRWIAAGGVWVTGYVLRFLQYGNIQAYAILFGAGVVALLYFVIFA